ncbi:MAG: anaerobic ribonucleoside-triphosphate reductase activating protein [Flexistipes sinusarabici]|uniref:Anaerobic ribonucleoside-triphosphate reductase activating protein n=1 Tax=Flexistipes sinusarabici TaxID=2352 RepID=A0A5D0MPN9_FLESI|nr:anaerobic ribonucleoside-triphosphate reductase activating protein [Flexistipes sinusarabici]TYB34015.1 MAG: anaerobic ribonucleoside-triphosphate reductase activating protein [Flexistipes sinusarabici]
MNIADFTPVSLVDFPGKVSSTAFTHGCNLRCRFCHNPELVLPLSAYNVSNEFFDYIKKNKLNAVTITGGEPLMIPHIAEIIKKLKNMNIYIKLDTNGSFPQKLKTLLQNDLLDYIALDLKGLNTDDIQYVTRNKNYTLDTFLETLNEIKSYEIHKGDTVKFEIRHTLWKTYSAADFSKFLNLLKQKDIYLKNDQKIIIQKINTDGKILDKRFKNNDLVREAISKTYLKKLQQDLEKLPHFSFRSAT